ncbi:hypothetical protein BJ165DRAFT_1407705 [Panaeolus papilionaceus]|nr:hypothetical protein BJ165DRAFT_1407705 [Panaeolus papilionaceus]
MPVVAVLPSNPPGTGGFGNSSNSSNSTPQIGSLRLHDEMSVAEIKAKARELVNKETRNASALTLIKAARTQSQSAKEQAARGELKTAFSSYMKAAILAKTVLESQEYAQETKKGGVIRKEINDFMENDGKDVLGRARELEEKLKAIENSQSSDQGDSKGGSGGKSIADRMRALQDNGLSLGPTKLRETPSLPTPPVSPRTGTTSTQYSPMIPPTSIAPSISGQSTHTLVSPSSFGPPSPTSTPPSSPPKTSLTNGYDDISSFNQNFPPIEDLDETPSLTLPSVPTAPVARPIPKDLKNGDAAPSPAALFRNYASQIERPSSTPITPINNFLNRPPSPNRTSKPSGLYNGIHGSNSASRVPIPNKNSALPQELRTYIRAHSVLLIDVRNRLEFDREHIKAEAVVCVEAPLLGREGITADALEEAMVVAPRAEASLFGNRDKFDLVVVYDQASTSFGSENSALSIIVRVIREQAFKKILKRPPMMLVGGLEAWKKDVGDSEVVRGTPELELQRPIPTRNMPPSMLPSTSQNSNNPFTNGSYMPTQHNTGSQHALWTPKQPRPDPMDVPFSADHRPTFSVDYTNHSRSPADAVYGGTHPPNGDLTRKPALTRPGSSSLSFSHSYNGTVTSPAIPSSLSGAPLTSPPITYPTFSTRRISPTTSGSNNNPFSPPPPRVDIASPPQASINPVLSRKRSDFVDPSQAPYSGSGFNGHAQPEVDYPNLNHTALIRPPPAAAPPSGARDRPVPAPFSPTYNNPDAKLRANTYDWPVKYWGDEQIGVSGLKNLGNTCYMNAPIQCLSATLPFARFFTEHRWRNAVNFKNPMGSQGRLTGAFAKLVHEMWGGDMPYLTPVDFRRSICHLNPQYNGSDQHDSQEFLSFLIDGIHEDLNRIVIKPPHNPTPEEEAELERLAPQLASDREWRAWRARNDSLIVDYFQGQFRSRLQCLTCHKTSTTYNVFSILQLPIPYSKSSKVSIDKCLETLLNEETLDKDDAWDCPQCKCKRRASKKLSLARLPPVLMIHFKRFEANGRFQDKIDTFVEYPLKNLDLTNYMPPALPPGVDKSQLNGGVPMSLDDPRTQQPPYRYDLYGVTNHYGNLSSGHYTAYIASHGGWRLCDDSSVKAVDAKQVVNQRAYVLFYKRVRS